MTALGARTWTAVCALDDLAPERGAVALVGDEQVALFRLVDDTVLAVQHLDPFSGAHVLARGIVGTRRAGSGGDGPDEPVVTVASPMHKQVFDLRTGRCLDAVGATPLPGLDDRLRTWAVRVVGDLVEVRDEPGTVA